MFMFHLRDSLVVSVGGKSRLLSSNDIFISSFNASFLGRNAQSLGFNNRFPLFGGGSVNFRC
jgi:hypothetical protein